MTSWFPKGSHATAEYVKNNALALCQVWCILPGCVCWWVFASYSSVRGPWRACRCSECVSTADTHTSSHRRSPCLQSGTGSWEQTRKNLQIWNRRNDSLMILSSLKYRSICADRSRFLCRGFDKCNLYFFIVSKWIMDSFWDDYL